ncbi:MAG: PAS domain-containing protein [Caldilineae bacterium]|nr:MAG: PAS domain-containing protein [Caldilineae bacterium]
MLAAASDGAFVIDENQRIVYWNRAAQQLLGFRAEEVVGQACYKIFGGRDERGRLICRYHCQVATTALDGRGVTSYDTCIRTKANTLLWVNMSILTYRAGQGDAQNLIVHLFRDATRKVQQQHFAGQVLNALEQLQQPVVPPLIAGSPPDGRERSLTGRERQVLTLLAQGFSTEDIAQTLSISLSTTRNHIQNILHKLNVHSRLEAVAYAFEHGLVSRPGSLPGDEA